MQKNPSDPVDDFKSWALKLGCPVNVLPTDAALNRFIRSNHANVQKLMNQVRPQAEVKLIRDNLLLHGLSKSNLTLERPQFDQPNDLHKLKKSEKLKRQIGELEPRVEQLKVQVKEKKSSLMEKAKQLNQVRNVYRTNQTKCTQLEQKHAQLVEKIGEEKRFESMLTEGMSVATAAPANERIAAEKAIKKSLEILRNVYAEVGEREFTKAQREKVERRVRETFAGIPVATLFETIKAYNCSEMNAIIEKFHSMHVHPSNGSVQSAFDVAVTKSRMKMYVDHLAAQKSKEDHAIRVDQYVQLYDEYLARIVDDMRSFNGSDVELFADSICGDYLKQYGTLLCNQAMLQFHQQKLSNLQQLATERDDRLKGSEVTTTELSDMYALIERTYNWVLDDIVSLSDVNKNMKQLQALSKYTINSFGSKTISCNTSNSLLNRTLGSIIPSITINLAPAEYLKELSLLIDIAHEKWNQLPVNISMDIESHRSNEAISPFYSLLTPNASLTEFKLAWAWYKVVDVLTRSLDVDKPVPRFADEELVSSNLNLETEKMLKSMEEIKFMQETGGKTVSEIRKYLAFLLDTSLGSFIPDRVVINKRTFKDYEEEFLCACSIISNSMKKN